MIPERMILPIMSIAAPCGNHLWHSTLVALFVAILVPVLRKNRPSLRYGLWTAASLKFLVPFSLLINFGTHLPGVASVAPRPSGTVYSALEATSQPFDRLRPAASANSDGSSRTSASALPAYLIVAWLCGALAVFFVWYLRWRQVSIMLRHAKIADSGREVEVLRALESELNQNQGIQVVRTRQMMEPGVFGITRPTLLWPEQLTERLDDQHIRAILAHELAHVRRRDNLTAALHMLVEALFWFHPLVWWMEARMLEERERACDEDVVDALGGPDIYAESLLKACRFCLESPLVCISGIAGADLRRRIVRITTNQRGTRLNVPRQLLLCFAALAVLAVPLSIGVMGATQSPASLLHPEGTKLPAFEIATIKPNRDVQAGLRMDLLPSDFNARGGSVEELIKFAYNVNSHDQLQGLEPDWISSRHFDIHAKASDADIARIQKLPAMQQVRELQLMLQSLLADRFHLKVSFKTADLPIYALVVSKGGPNLNQVQEDPLPPPGTPTKPGAHLPRFGKTGPNQYSAVSWDMSSTADILSQFDEIGHRLVVDETGLKGHYDFVLNGVSIGPTADGTSISIFTALKEQLGLELVPRKAPVEVLVINSVEPPSEN